MSNDLARQQIAALQRAMEASPDEAKITPPLEHLFGEGTYCRVMRLSEGDLIVGKTHRFDHVVAVLYGNMGVADVSGARSLYCTGQVFESKAGTKRAIIALTDCAMMTIHPNPTNTRDIAQLEAELIQPEESP